MAGFSTAAARLGTLLAVVRVELLTLSGTEIAGLGTNRT